MAIERIDELLDPSFVAGLADLPLGEVRRRRDQCQEASDVLSYLRRMVQGRLDLVQAELEARTSGEGGGVEAIVERLKRGEILAGGTRASGFGRLPTNLDPADADGWIARELEQTLGADRLGRLEALDAGELDSIRDGLVNLERKVSDQRNVLHERTNLLQEEIVRRYKSGEATVDSLLA